MIKRLWQWFKNFWQRLFSRKQAVFPQDSESKVKIPKLSDAEYQQFFRQLLDKVNDESWSRGRVKALLDGNNIVESDLVRWLRGFGEKLLARDGENRKLAQRMMRLSEVGFGELSQLAGEIGRELLRRGGEEEVGKEEMQQAIGLDDLLVMMQQDDNLRQQVAQQLGIDADDSKVIVTTTEAFFWLNQGEQQVDIGDFEEAIVSYDKAIAIKPDFHDAWRCRGAVLCDNLQKYAEALESFEKAIEIEPEDFYTWHNKIEALNKLKRFEEAITSCRKTIDILLGLPNTDEMSSEIWNKQGIALSGLERFEEAIISYDKSIELKPNHHHSWSNRGDALADLNRFEEAIASYDRALEIKPYSHLAWNNRAYALLHLRLFEEAVASFDQAFKTTPDKHKAWFDWAYALIYLERFEEAIKSFKQAIKFKPDYYQAWYNLALGLQRLGLIEEAISANDKALQIKSDFYQAWSNRGACLRDLGQFEEAIASFDQALQIEPDDNLAWNNRGIGLKNLGLFEEAIASYDKAIEIQPDYYPTWLNRGITVKNLSACNSFLASMSFIVRQNPELNKRDYEGELISYHEGLKYCQQNTHPEGWGMLHQAIGKAHYYEGEDKPNYRQYWLQAESEYKQALITITSEAFPELHLKVLRDLIRVLFGLGKNDEAKQHRRQALEVFRNLLNSLDKSSFQKRKLQAEFYGFSQMRVDVLIEDGDFIPALETAERDKNFYLTWILDNQKEHILSPSYTEIQKLVNPNTAIIYWHLSPFALTTFIIQPGAVQPIVIPTQRTDKLEAWIKNWDKQYEDYRKAKKQQSSNPDWRNNLPELLEQLSEILNISHITETIQDSNSQIQNLILIPHRDLHRFPLHGLFPDNFNVNYLPSAQIGLTLNSQSQNLHQNIINPNLLIVEYSGAGRENEGLERLTYSQIESETIARIFENTNYKYISDNEADKNTVKQALAGYNILHFSGHGSYDSKRPQNSAIYLNYDSTDKKINPDLTLPEIHNLNLKGYQLVSLSACETAITGNETVEAEYVGLVSAFLDRGVSYVVSSLWTVNEICTSLLMIYFYRQIKKGKAPKIALARAIKWLRSLDYKKLERFYRFSFSKLSEGDSSRIILEAYLQSIENNKDKLFNHPYYWAGFIITGV
jgi:tetratricopeptide (TPR) repeat protein